MATLNDAKYRTILESIYQSVTKTQLIWVAASNYDGRILRAMWNKVLIDFDKSGRFVTLTDRGMGVLLFSDEDADVVLANV